MFYTPLIHMVRKEYDPRKRPNLYASKHYSYCRCSNL